MASTRRGTVVPVAVPSLRGTVGVEAPARCRGPRFGRVGGRVDLGRGALEATEGAGMQPRPLGRPGVSGSQFCLGTMMFGSWGNPDHDESIRIIHAALHAGINFIDTADVYGAGESEEIVGRALARGRRDDVVLATKFHNPMGEDPQSARQL